MAKQGTFRLWHRTDKPNKSGAAPVHLLFSVSGKKICINTGVIAYPEQYNDGEIMALPPKVGRTKYNLKIYEMPTSEDAKRDNETIMQVITDIKRICDRFRLDGITYTSAMVKAEYDKIRYPERKQKTDITFAEWANQLVQKAQAGELVNKKGRTISKGTAKEYNTTATRINEYDTKTLLSDIGGDWLAGFFSYLTTTGMNNITAAKLLSTAKTFIGYADFKGIPINQNYKKFTPERYTDLEVISLTRMEFTKLLNFDLKGDTRLEKIRDVFLFSCATGLRYSDLSQLSWHQIDDNYIKQRSVKRKRLVHIPLNHISRKILAKYKDLPKPLPIISNQKSNEALHDLCAAVGINENIEIVRYRGAERITDIIPKHELISMHSGRKTFATLSVGEGKTIPEVMAWGGWTDYRSFRRYVNVQGAETGDNLVNIWD